jgi:hypothetical protein
LIFFSRERHADPIRTEKQNSHPLKNGKGAAPCRVAIHASMSAEVSQSANPQPMQVVARRAVVSLMAKAARAVNTMADCWRGQDAVLRCNFPQPDFGGA